MRVFRSLPALTAVLVFTCADTTLSAEEATQEDSLSRLVAHFGKVMKLPTGQRVVFYTPLDEVWYISEDSQTFERGTVRTDPPPAWKLELHWQDGDIDAFDASNIDQITLLDETPVILTQLEQIRGERLAEAVGELPAGAQLLEGGAVLDGEDKVIGDWEIILPGIVARPLNGSYTFYDLTDLVAALPTEKKDK